MIDKSVRTLSLAILTILAGEASAHDVLPTADHPLGWQYALECCHSLDCALIPAETVKELPDGYHVTLDPGQHPMLRKHGYSGVVPYETARPSPSGDYHICLSLDGAHRYCFYAGARGF